MRVRTKIIYIYILKFDFKNESDAQFLQEVEPGWESATDLIKRNAESGKNLGEITCGDSVYAGKNIAFLVKDSTKLLSSEHPFHGIAWDYKENAGGKWANKRDPQKVSAHILAEHSAKDKSPDNRNKFWITQTNIPGLPWRGIKKSARLASPTIIEGLRKTWNLNVILADYIKLGTDEAPSMSDNYIELIEDRNKGHVAPPPPYTESDGSSTNSEPSPPEYSVRP